MTSINLAGSSVRREKAGTFLPSWRLVWDSNPSHPIDSGAATLSHHEAYQSSSSGLSMTSSFERVEAPDYCVLEITSVHVAKSRFELR